MGRKPACPAAINARPEIGGCVFRSAFASQR